MESMEAGAPEFNSPCPTRPLGEGELPELDLPDLTDDDIEETLKGMGT
ncbi:hypothetical protein [Streptomyces chumphonensis]